MNRVKSIRQKRSKDSKIKFEKLILLKSACIIRSMINPEVLKIPPYADESEADVASDELVRSVIVGKIEEVENYVKRKFRIRLSPAVFYGRDLFNMNHENYSYVFAKSDVDESKAYKVERERLQEIGLRIMRVHGLPESPYESTHEDTYLGNSLEVNKYASTELKGLDFVRITEYHTDRESNLLVPHKVTWVAQPKVSFFKFKPLD